ncbi:hypothetical protein GS506_09640 [Rhodococcus hoagii]|nr:hypothetical protein [Prescottella equi]
MARGPDAHGEHARQRRPPTLLRRQELDGASIRRALTAGVRQARGRPGCE